MLFQILVAPSNSMWSFYCTYVSGKMAYLEEMKQLTMFRWTSRIKQYKHYHFSFLSREKSMGSQRLNIFIFYSIQKL